MKKMLQLVKQKVENNNIDMTLKFTLSALWNLTGTVKHFIMPPTLKKLKGHIALGLSVHACVRPSVTSLR